MKWIGCSSFICKGTSFSRRIIPSRRGFSIAELAIVLGVIGIISAGIWTVGIQGRESSRQQALTSDIATIVRNTRAFLAGQAGATGTFATLTAQLTSLSPPAIPGDMLRTGGSCNVAAPSYCADTPWGAQNATTGTNGSLGVCAWDPTVPGCAAAGVVTQLFSVELQAMPQGSCIVAVQLNSGPNAPPGLYDVVIDGTSMLAAGNQFPIIPSLAQANCVGGDTIDFVFRVAAPQS